MQPAVNLLHGMLPPPSVPRSMQDLGHRYMTTFKAGLLIPFLCQEGYPGDTFRCITKLYARMLSPLDVANMDIMTIDTFYFKVAMRQVWIHTKQFFGERDTLAEILTPTEYLMPVLSDDGENPYIDVAVGSIYDYMGLPITADSGVDKGALKNIRADFCRAYNYIWNEWFRNQSLQEKVTVNDDDGPDDYEYVLLPRNKRLDYFTACLPWPQKGDEVMMPLGDIAPVRSGNTEHGGCITLGLWDGTHPGGLYNDGGTLKAQLGFNGDPVHTVESQSAMDTGTIALYPMSDHLYTGAYADLAQAESASVNDMRYAETLQRYLEMDARGGTRYIEKNYVHFGQQSSDMLQFRPEFLGGGSQRINVNPITQTSADSGAQYLGRLASFATVFDQNGFTTSCEEHCLIIGMFSVRHDVTYSQGIDRKWTRRDPLDFFWPIFSGLGEQEVMRRELFAVGGDDDDTEVFGYGPRYDDLRHERSKITGFLRPEVNNTLCTWNMSQNLLETVALNTDFIQGKDDVEIYRASKIQTGHQFIIDMDVDLKVARCIPTYGIPGKQYL